MEFCGLYYFFCHKEVECFHSCLSRPDVHRGMGAITASKYVSVQLLARFTIVLQLVFVHWERESKTTLYIIISWISLHYSQKVEEL